MNKLARDDTQAILQVGSYNTKEAVTIADGGSLPPNAYDKIYRMCAVYDTVWIGVGEVPTVDTTLPLLAGSEITMLVYAGNALYVTGGALSVVPLGA